MPFPKPPRSLETRSADKYTPRNVDWIWKNHLARGMLVLLAGVSTAGKSTIAFNWAAAISVGGLFPDGTQAPIGDILIWSAEDNIEDTIVPRLIAAGANLKRIHFIHGKFNPKEDLPLLLAKLKEMPDLILVVFDPVISSVSGNANLSAVVRSTSLEPLRDTAEETKVCILGIHHFNKSSQGLNPMDRVSGGGAFGQVPRLVHVVAKNKEIGGPNSLIRLKVTNGVEGGGYAYRIIGVDVVLKDITLREIAKIEWLEEIEGSAQEILDEVEEVEETNGPDKSPRELGRAKYWLKETLKDGPLPKKTIEEESKMAGFSPRTLR